MSGAEGGGDGVFWRIMRRIPDPIVIFIGLYALAFLLTVVFAGTTFALPGGRGETAAIKSMATTENVRWVFDNALVRNWVSFAHGLVPIVVVVMMGVGLAERSGFLGVLVRLLGRGVNDKVLTYVVVGIGVLSSIASDAAYFVLIPLVATLYATIGRNPFVGIAAAFAGVSAGFGANVIPATPNDIVIGLNTVAFAEQLGVPAVSRNGAALSAPTMDYFYMAGLFVVFTLVGGFVTNRYVAKRVSRIPWQYPDDHDEGGFAVSRRERRAIVWALLALAGAVCVAVAFARGPLAPYVTAAGARRVPYMDDIILFVAFAFGCAGVAYGFAAGKFRCVADLISASVRQVGSMSYFLVLTFFSFNFLALFSYSNLGAFVACAGARALVSLDLGSSPCLLLVGFMVLVGLVNMCISSLSAKWMLLGPIFIPMLYHVSPLLTPEVVTAAYRTADPCTNIVTPVMNFAGVVLVFCRRWNGGFTIGDQIMMMIPYSLAFFVASTLYLLVWFKSGLPFGF